MISATLRASRVAAIAVAVAVLAPGLARAQDPPPAPPGPPPGYPPTYQPPPGHGPPTYAPAPYTPMAYGPDEITEFDDSAPVPDGYTKVSRTRKGPVIGGAVTLGVTYGIAAMWAWIGMNLKDAGEIDTDFSSLWIPVAGPFLQLGRTDSAAAKAPLVPLGAAQTAGAVLLLWGLTSTRTTLVRNDRLAVVPMIGGGASGMFVAGRF